VTQTSKYPKTRRERRVSLTLTVGECDAIRSSVIFQLSGNYAEALRFWIRRGLEETLKARR